MKLLDRLKAGLAPEDSGGSDPERDVQIAAAVLLLAMEHADHAHDPDERAEITRELRAHFDLDAADAQELVAAAEPEAEAAISLHRYLEALNQQMPVTQKRRVLEMLWRVAYADRQLDAQEEALLREIADLLHLPHRDFIQAKLAVTENRPEV